MTKARTLHRLTVTVEPDTFGEGFDVDAICACQDEESGRLTERGWVWSGWAESPARAGSSVFAEWNEHVTTHP